MKNFLFVLLIIATTFAHAGELDGKTYCRTVNSGGMGVPEDITTFEHCVHFEDNTMTDNANSFFGNPPSSKNYVIESEMILEENETGEFEIAYYLGNPERTMISNSAGAKLILTE